MGSAGGATTIYCGVDFRARVNRPPPTAIRPAVSSVSRNWSTCGMTSAASMPAWRGKVTVGQEAGGYSSWLVEFIKGLGHRVVLGDAAESRRLAE